MYHDFTITVKELSPDPSPLHKHPYFELIYVMTGSGLHHINANGYRYEKGNLFLLTPEDLHTFIPETLTIFCIVDFTKN